MVDTTTSFLGLVKQTIGGNRNTWGIILNACMDLLEGGLYGTTSKVVTGAGDVTLTDSERRKHFLVFTGTLAADQTIIVANIAGGRWTVRNATSGNFALKFKTPSGTAVTIPQGGNCTVWCDGADTIYADLSTRLRDTQMLSPSGTLAAPGLSWASEVASGFYRVSAGVFAWVIAGVERLRVSATAFAIILADTGTVTITIDGTQVVQVSESGVAVTGAFTVGGQAPVPVGAEMDYAGIQEPNGWKFRNGQALNRTTYATLFNAITFQTTGNLAAGSNVIYDVNGEVRFLGLLGAYIEGTGIPTGTTITAIASNQFTLSAAVAGSANGVALRVLPHGQGNASTTFNIPDDKGRVNPGRDDMGGTAANRLTSASGIVGTRLGGVGGSETVTLVQGHLPAGITLSTSIASGQGSHSHDIRGFPQSDGSGNVTFLSAANNNTISGASGSAIQGTTLPAMSGTTPLGGSGAAVNNVQPSRVTNKIIFTGVYT